MSQEHKNASIWHHQGAGPATALDRPAQTGSSLMATNRSVLPGALLPHITGQDAAQTSAWLTAILGFTEHYRCRPANAPCGAKLPQLERVADQRQLSTK
jgi:hypothetical protein